MDEHYGQLDGESVRAVTLESGALKARLITYGARLTELWVPDRRGNPADIVLGHDSLDDYVASKAYFGATVGRYGNRIAGGRFLLDGVEYQLDLNEGANHLHGGHQGFDRKNWTLGHLTPTSVTFHATSWEGEMGYPGRCELTSTYELTDEGLRIVMTAETSAPTVLNMVHHSYFNLAGEGDVLAQELRLAAPFYTPVDAELLATGAILPVAGTPFDFMASKPIGRDIAGAPGGKGYDHNWCLSEAGVALRDCAEAHDPTSGRRMTLRKNQPGVQVYTGGYLSASMPGKRGETQHQYGGFTLETQKFPGTPNHPQFPSCVLRPGETYRHEMLFTFAAD
ncbi:Aldose 1-epimerase [Rubellimicrobium mesophilum DSM 19309]|uniref:Aldose 1-epimerase n=1 Tax=Rubellimicrobium mesophilum DSM 19309 TaxID=442562 RepID=A0A017HM79_9RHOB|nr:aldose epimerase family protein [Rubellimicrobium mesophilum]EYD75273.1 Aldose 1-epimerase [Rubellimicrobium mesophilum DSM 19309]